MDSFAIDGELAAHFTAELAAALEDPNGIQGSVRDPCPKDPQTILGSSDDRARRRPKRGHPPPERQAASRHCVPGALEAALRGRYGAQAIADLLVVLKGPKWACRPRHTQIACELLLERHALDPKRYVHSLWAEAEKRLDLEAEEAARRAYVTEQDEARMRAARGSLRPLRSCGKAERRHDARREASQPDDVGPPLSTEELAALYAASAAALRTRGV